jgi:hypothetical protein
MPTCAYQTAWLKAHYPTHFYAAVLSNEIANTDKVARYVAEMKILRDRPPAAGRQYQPRGFHSGWEVDPFRARRDQGAWIGGGAS